MASMGISNMLQHASRCSSRRTQKQCSLSDSIACAVRYCGLPSCGKICCLSRSITSSHRSRPSRPAGTSSYHNSMTECKMQDSSVFRTGEADAPKMLRLHIACTRKKPFTRMMHSRNNTAHGRVSPLGTMRHDS